MAEIGQSVRMGWGIFHLFPTKDVQQVFIAVTSNAHWERFCQAFGLDDLLADETLDSNPKRAAAQPRVLLPVPVPLVGDWINRWLAPLPFFRVFALLHVVPGDPVQLMMHGRATPETLAAAHAKLGLDRPLLVQYWNFISGAATGSLGTSIIQNASVSKIVGERMVPTVLLLVTSALFAIIIALPLSILAARRSVLEAQPRQDAPGAHRQRIGRDHHRL